MLISKPTKYGTGIEIYGDYNDFRELHDFIHEASENDVVPYKFQEYLLGFAYEVRKSYEGSRETKDFSRFMPNFEFEKNLLYVGFRYFWIHHLLTVRLLRWSAGFRPTTLQHQAMLYKLEALTFSALSEYDANQAEIIWQRLSSYEIFSENYALQWIDECLDSFLSLANGKKRFNSIPAVLNDIYSLSEGYRTFYSQLKKTADEKKCRIDDLRSIEESEIEFKW